MKLNEVQEQFDRIARDIRRSEQRMGNGTSWSVDLPDGRKVRYIINGVPPIQDLDDHVKNGLVNLWSMKDYLILEMQHAKGLAEKKAKSLVHAAVSSCKALEFCADLANGIKHRELTYSRTGRYPRLEERGGFTLTLRRDPDTHKLVGSGVERMTFRADEVEIDTMNQNNPEWVDYWLKVIDKQGRQAGEACQIMKTSYDAWAKFVHQHQLAWPSLVKAT